jgi:hypothetical protein
VPPRSVQSVSVDHLSLLSPVNSTHPHILDLWRPGNGNVLGETMSSLSDGLYPLKHYARTLCRDEVVSLRSLDFKAVVMIVKHTQVVGCVASVQTLMRDLKSRHHGDTHAEASERRISPAGASS